MKNRWMKNMNIKTLNVKLTALRPMPETSLEMDILRKGKIIHQIRKSMEAANVKTVLTQAKYQMYQLYPGEYVELTTFPTENFDTNRLSSMATMFADCKKVQALDLSNFNTKNVSIMNEMFLHCEELTSIDLSGFDVSNVAYMRNMFNGCKSLTSLDLSSFKITKNNVFDLSGMFHHCDNLQEIKGIVFEIPAWADYDGMFEYCSNLTGVKIKNPPPGFTDHSNVNCGWRNKAGLRADQYEIVQ